MANWLTKLFGGGKTAPAADQPAEQPAPEQPAAPAAEETAAAGEITPEAAEEKPAEQQQ